MISRGSVAGLRAFVAAGVWTILLLSNAQRAPAQDAPDHQSTSDAPVLTPSDGKQSKRILGIFPNYRAVSANTQLPPL